MAIQTYADLRAELTKYVIDDIGEILDTCISATEAVLNREIRHRKMVRRSSATLAQGQRFLELPSDFLEPERIIVDATTNVVLSLVSEAELDQLFPTESQGKPSHFALTAESLKFGPAPDGEYTIELVYYSEIPALNDTNPSNWLLLKYPDLYLFGSMLHAGPAVRDPEMLNTASTFFQRGIQSMNGEASRTAWKAGPLSVKFDFEVI